MEQEIIIYGVNFIEEEEFTFNNFDELKGYLKGKKMYVENAEQCQQVCDILKLLGFTHMRRIISLQQMLENSSERLITINNSDFTVDFTDNDSEAEIYGEDLIEDYNILKVNLIFSIIPWPITCEEAKEMTVFRLGKMNVFCSDMLKRLEELNFSDKDLEIFIDKNAIDKAKEFIENYEIQIDNLRYIW